jgi:hypothetical protein
MVPPLGKILILLGLALLGLGVLMTLAPEFPHFKLGRLPGDFYFRKGNFSFFVPLTTSILVSLLLTIFLWLFSKR